jgi:hypothetical protein
MQITINLDTDSASDLAALAALVASLGGRTVVAAPQRPTPLATLDGSPTPNTSSTGNGAASPASSVVPTGSPQSASGQTAQTEQPPVDKTGLPWDERIHAGTKDTNGDGSWRKRRGVDDATVAAVTAELRGDAPLPPEPASEEVPPPPASDERTETPEPPVTTPAVTASPTADATSAASIASFPELVKACNALGKTYVELNAISADLGVAKFQDMKDKPDLWDMFLGMVKG